MSIPFYYSPIRKKFSLKKHLDGFETLKKVIVRRNILSRLLLKHKALPLKHIQKLKKCKRKSPCNQPFCPKCIRQLRRWFASEGMPNLINKGAFMVTIIPENLQREQGKLDELDMGKIKNRIRKKLSRTALKSALIIGGIDFSYNEYNYSTKHKDCNIAPHWQPHLHFICTGVDKNTLSETLKASFKRSKTVDKPVRVEAIKDEEGLLKALSYCISPYFNRRLGYTGKNGRKEARNLPLKNTELIEITKFMSKHSIQDRLFLRNCRRYGYKLCITSVTDKRRKRL